MRQSVGKAASVSLSARTSSVSVASSRWEPSFSSWRSGAARMRRLRIIRASNTASSVSRTSSIVDRYRPAGTSAHSPANRAIQEAVGVPCLNSIELITPTSAMFAKPLNIPMTITPSTIQRDRLARVNRRGKRRTSIMQ